MRFVMTISTDQIQELAGTKAGARLSALICRRLLDSAILQNRILMRLARLRGRPLPQLYKSGVRYRREPKAATFQELADVNTVYARGWGDCKHLVAIRCAEQLEKGKQAHPLIYWRFDADGLPSIYHAELRHGPRDGVGPREDPSRFLGM